MTDTALTVAIHAVLTASPFHGEGYRKVCLHGLPLCRNVRDGVVLRGEAEATGLSAGKLSIAWRMTT
jgi:hypothetical protein